MTGNATHEDMAWVALRNRAPRPRRPAADRIDRQRRNVRTMGSVAEARRLGVVLLRQWRDRTSAADTFKGGRQPQREQNIRGNRGTPDAAFGAFDVCIQVGQILSFDVAPDNPGTVPCDSMSPGRSASCLRLDLCACAMPAGFAFCICIALRKVSFPSANRSGRGPMVSPIATMT